MAPLAGSPLSRLALGNSQPRAGEPTEEGGDTPALTSPRARSPALGLPRLEPGRSYFIKASGMPPPGGSYTPNFRTKVHEQDP